MELIQRAFPPGRGVRPSVAEAPRRSNSSNAASTLVQWDAAEEFVALSGSFPKGETTRRT
jgi:hypothetical protein